MYAGLVAWIGSLIAYVIVNARVTRVGAGATHAGNSAPAEDTGKKNNTQYILAKLKECKGIAEELDVVNTWLDGPKFRVAFDNAEDAIRFSNRIPYRDREGTVTFARPLSDGVYVFTGGKISQDEALAVFNAIRAPGSNQKKAIFYDWDPPQLDSVAK